MQSDEESSESLFLLDHCLDTVVHVLDKVDLRSAESAEVADVINVIISLRMFTMGTSDLHVVLISDSLEVFLLVSELGESDMD